MFKHIDIHRNMHTARSLCGVFVSLLIVVLCGMSNMALATDMKTCDKGEYLPKEADKCEDCPDKKYLGKLYCPGGEYFKDYYWGVQGVEYCKGLITSSGICNTDKAESYIEAGKFRPAGTNTRALDCTDESELKKAKQSIRTILSTEPTIVSNFCLWKIKGLSFYYEQGDTFDNIEVEHYIANLLHIADVELNCDNNTITSDSTAEDVSGLVCPGGDTGYDRTFPLGIHVCPGGQVATADRKGCESKLPDPVLAESESNNNGNSQSSTTTDDTKNNDNTTKVSLQTAASLGIDNLRCDKGNVLVGIECVPCSSKPAWVTYANESRMYCPGGEKIKIGTPLTDQLTRCPAGMWPNRELSDCVCGYGLTKQDTKCSGTLSYYDMYYGPSGEETPLFKQCWTKTTDKAYKKCMGFDN